MAGVYTPGEPQITSPTGAEQLPVDTQLPGGQYPQTGYITAAQLGLGTSGTVFLTAAGTTQLGATAIAAGVRRVIVNVATTASTHGVRLPVAATGLSVTVGNSATFGVKVYPATNGSIAAASTNAADSTVLAINKANTYLAVSATRWVVERGA